MSSCSPDPIETFISRWENSGAAERANYQMFLSELCDILGVPRPDPTSPDPEKNLYVLDRAITRVNPDGSSVTNYIDLYKARHCVWETKQGITAEETIAASKTGHGRRGTIAFDRALERAYHQGRDYITHLPASHGRPPFLVVCDVGHSIDLYSEFTCTGGRYERFPDPKNHRILLTDLRRPAIRERLRLVFTDPLSLDPSKKAAEVTRDIATRLAKLAKSLEADGHDPRVTAGFLQRCLFTMFAEDIGLLPENGFRDLLEKVKSSPQGFPVLITALWKEMATGTQYSALLFQEIAHFNGGLFENTTALPLTAAQLEMLADAAASDWSEVEPSIFGTLLTRALDSRERHKLGAEYTPRSYVERLIRPTIIEPLREEWEAVRIAAASLHLSAEAAEDSAAEMDGEIKALGATPAAKKIGAAAAKLRAEAKKKDAEALKLVTTFHRHLCAIKVLDPACGTANFLYVTLEHMKRLEAEVLELVTALGGDATFEMNEYKVRPEQFLGLELSHNAVAIAQLVLWIGYFQWQRKTTGKADTGDRPLLPKTQSIRQQDAVLAFDERIPRKDPETGETLTIWNGHTTKPHPVTGKEVPDETARTVLFDYLNPRRAEWPPADYIVGNPPFIGASRMRDALGDGYTESLRKAWKGDVPESADLVMFWWSKAAAETAQGRCKRFGFITTNSIHQTFNRRVIEPFLEGRDGSPSRPADGSRMAKTEKKSKGLASAHSSSPHPHGRFGETSLPLHLAYAIPDHPWIDSADGAAVRIAMTVAAPGQGEGILEKVTAERPMQHGEVEVSLDSSTGNLAANLQLGSDLTSCLSLRSNENLSNRGFCLFGAGFIVESSLAETLASSSSPQASPIIWHYRNGKDLTNRPRGVMVIDAFPCSLDELQTQHPGIYQHLLLHVKPERDNNSREGRKKLWWAFGEPNKKLRDQLAGLPRYIATVETSKHRFFTFLDLSILPDNMLVCIASDDAFHLGVLSSSIHVTWALSSGGRLGMGNDPRYNKSKCFDPFPFPALEEGALKQRIRDLGERLDLHRKRQQEAHPGLTLTGMYNVLEKLRGGDLRSPSANGDRRSPPPLTAKEKQIHDQGLVTLLKQIHDELDEAVLQAYGWSDLKTEDLETQDTRKEEMLARLVALNHARAAEENTGHIRWLRPEYQNRSSDRGGDLRSPTQAHLPGTETESPQSKIQNQQPVRRSFSEVGSSIGNPSSIWPDRLPAQVILIRQLLATDPTATPEQLSNRFDRKNPKRTEQIEGMIETLRDLGQV